MTNEASSAPQAAPVTQPVSKDTLNALTDFDFCLALAQVAINTQMVYAWKSWKLRKKFQDTIKIFKTTDDDGNVVDAAVGLEATLAPIAVSMNVPSGKLGQVRVTLTLTSGMVTYIDERRGTLAHTPVQNWSVSFIADLDKHPIDLGILAQIDPAAHQTATKVIRNTGLPESVFSIEYLFMKLTEVDLVLADNKDILIPAAVPRAARVKALDSLNFLLQGELGNFMLGSVVRRNDKQAAPTFALTDFIFDVHANPEAPEASTLAYLGMLANRPLPADPNLSRTKLEYAWVRPEQLNGTESTVSGIMAIGRNIFMDQYLISAFTKEIGKAPVADHLTWTYSDSSEQTDTSSDIIDREWNAGRGWTLAVSIVPGTNTLQLAGKIYSHANMDGYTKGLGKLGHTEWIHTAGHQDLSGSVALEGGGIGTAFHVDPRVNYKFGDLIVDQDDVIGGAKVLNAFERVFSAMHFTGSTTEERLGNAQMELVKALDVWLDRVLKSITLDLGHHAFIPPGGGVFTFQNPHFSAAGDLLFDVIYQAP